MTITAEERLRGERLRKWCDDAQGKPFVWGQDDCSLWPFAWVVNETGREIDVPVYSSREEAEAIIAAEGGLEAVWSRVACGLGLVEVSPIDVPPLGSVGVITMGHETPTGCIFAHGQIGCFRTQDKADVSLGGVRMIGLRRWTIIRAWALA